MMADKNKAQVTLELAISLFMVILLFFLAVKVFFWANNRMVSRQKAYEASPETGRVNATNWGWEGPVQTREDQLEQLDLFDLKGLD